jgi:hypothetical protein
MIRLQEILLRLAEAEVDFVIVGGVAAALHGSSSATFDLDLCYSREPANLERLSAALRAVRPRLRGAPEGLPFVLDSQTLRSGLNFTLVTDLGDLDLLGEISGVGAYREVQAASVQVSVFGRSFAVLSLEALIRAKQAAGRPKDQLTLPELKALREAEAKAREGE